MVVLLYVIGTSLCSVLLYVIEKSVVGITHDTTYGRDIAVQLRIVVCSYVAMIVL